MDNANRQRVDFLQVDPIMDAILAEPTDLLHLLPNVLFKPGPHLVGVRFDEDLREFVQPDIVEFFRVDKAL